MSNYLQFDYDIADNYISINLGDLYQKEIRLLMLYINQKFPNNEGCKIQINSLYDTYKERIKYKEWEEKHTQKKKYMPPFKLGAGKGETCWEEFTSYKIVVDKKREAEAAEDSKQPALVHKGIKYGIKCTLVSKKDNESVDFDSKEKMLNVKDLTCSIQEIANKMKNHCFITGKSGLIFAFGKKDDAPDNCIYIACEEQEALTCHQDIENSAEL